MASTYNPQWLVNRCPNDIQSQVRILVQRGYVVTHQDAKTAQLTRKKRFSFLIAFLSLLVFGVGFILYLIWYLAKRDDTVYLELDKQQPKNEPIGHVTPATTKTLVFVIVALLLLIAWRLWPVTVPAVVAWFVWKKTKLPARAKIIMIAVVSVAFISAGLIAAHADRAPQLSVTDPKDNSSIQAHSITVRGKVDPASSAVTVDGQAVTANSDGSFQAEAALPNENNSIHIDATNHGNTTTVTLNVVRTYTDAEKAAQAQLKAEADAKQQADLLAQQKAKAEADAQAKAAQAAYDASAAGKLCKKHPDWTKDDCQGVVDNKVWIGMTYDMLVIERGGKPNNVNPSNYGGGTQYQWCWTDFTPSCFYGGTDGIITSYN